MGDWITSSKYSIDHISGRWRISKTKGKTWAYTLWKKVDKAWKSVEFFKSADLAKAYVTENDIE